MYSFGPFTLDPRSRRLLRDGEPVAVSDRHLEILLAFAANPGKILSKDALISAAWRDVAVGDNSLEQAISSLRRTLGTTADGAPYIETLPRRGYRLTSAVAVAAPREDDDALDALLGPHRAFIEGRSALESLDREAIARARGVFARTAESSPHFASAHIGLANALALGFEATRADAAPDVAALRAAGQHAREACRLDPASGEAWATLAFVLSRLGASGDALASARRAVALEPDNWRHHVRLSYVSWGEERLRAAQRVLKLMPGLALAHWLAATVHVARQALDEAERELTAGCAAQDGQHEGARFSAVGLHLLLGLVRLARGDRQAALDHFDREVAREGSSHLYAREACANAWCAIAAVRLRDGDAAAAHAAFDRARALVPGHPEALSADPPVLDATTLAAAGRHDDAASRLVAALDGAASGSFGWLVPVDPFLDVAAHADAWSPVLARLRGRAA